MGLICLGKLLACIKQRGVNAANTLRSKHDGKLRSYGKAMDENEDVHHPTRCTCIGDTSVYLWSVLISGGCVYSRGCRGGSANLILLSFGPSHT